MRALRFALVAALLPLLIAPVLPRRRVHVDTGGSDCASSPSIANCLYYQDFESGGGTTDCTAESPAMDSGGDCAYTTSPAPLAGSQSAEINTLIMDQNAFTAVSSSTTLHGYFMLRMTDNDGAADIEVFRALNGSTNVPPRIRVGTRSFPTTFRLRLYCDENFSGEGTSYTAESINLGTDSPEATYEVWWAFTQNTGAGQFWVKGGTECPTGTTTGCTQSCDGAAASSGIDGFRFPQTTNSTGNYIIDNVIFDGTAVPNQP